MTNEEEPLLLPAKYLSRKEFFAHTSTELAEDILFVEEFLQKYYHARCYIAGGAVRDVLLGLKCKDIDIECYDISVEDFEIAMGNLGAQGAGKSFFVYKYRQLDISLPRTERKTGVGHKGFEVTLTTQAKEASQRRDFTINAMMYDIQNQQILDFWYGIDDLKHKVLRVVDPHSFGDDSLRVLRAMQFASRFGFKVEPQSCLLCQKIALSDLPKERVFLEFEKMFVGDYPYYGLYYLFALGIADKIFGISLERKSFMLLARRLCRAQDGFMDALRPYYFLYIISPFLGYTVKLLLDRIGAPNIYYRKIAKAPPLPDRINSAFVANMAFKHGINEFVGNYHPEVAEIARRLNIWEKPYDKSGIIKELIADGFEGISLGQELERRVQKKIGALDLP